MPMVTLLKALASAVLLLLLPGYLTRLAWFPRLPSDEPQDALSFLVEVLLFSLVWTGGWGVVLAHLGWFSLTGLWLISLGYGIAVGVWLRAAGRPLSVPLRVDWRSGVPVLFILVLGSVFFFRPHEFIFGGADAGVYVNLGANIARTGAWRIRDPVIAQLPSELYPGVFREHPPSMIPQYVPLPGTYLTDGSTGEVTPQFYPLHPVWLAIFYAIGGLRLSLFATPLWGLLACVMVYFAGKASFGFRVGLLSATLLILTATQIWFSRYPTAEVLTQLLLFGGLYAFARHLDQSQRSSWWGVLAGLALGQALLVRLDLYFLLAVPLGYGVYLRLERRFDRGYWAFTIPFLLQLVYSLTFAVSRTWPYFYNVYSFSLRALPMFWPYLVGAGILGILGVIAVESRVFGRWEERDGLRRVWRWGARSLAVVVLLLAVYGYFVRPHLANPVASYYYWYGDHQVPNVEQFNFVRLGWYLTPLGLVLAVAGAILVLWRDLDARTTLLMGMGLFFSVLFIHSSRNNPHHIYVMRRYVPVVIPFFMMMAAYALDAIGICCVGYRRWVASALTILLAAWLLYNARVVVRHVEYAGLVDQFRELVQMLGDEPAVILFNDARPVSSAATVGTPLRYIQGFTVLDLQETHLDVPLLAEQVKGWQADGQQVWVVAGEASVPLLFRDWRCEHRADVELRYPVLEATYEHFPRQVWWGTMPLRICELLAVP